MKLLTIALTSFFFIILRDVESADHETVKLTVFYETLCPYSIAFVTEQLYSTSKNFSEYITLDLVPFGKGNLTHLKTGKWFYTCQHGEKECYGNRVHACVIDQTSEDSIMIDVLNKLMEGNYTDKEIEQCFKEFKLDYNGWKKCMPEKSYHLLEPYQTRTHSEHIKGVPTVYVNNMYNETVDVAAVNNLPAVVCSFLKHPPKICGNIDIEAFFNNLNQEMEED